MFHVELQIDNIALAITHQVVYKQSLGSSVHLSCPVMSELDPETTTNITFTFSKSFNMENGSILLASQMRHISASLNSAADGIQKEA